MARYRSGSPSRMDCNNEPAWSRGHSPGEIIPYGKARPLRSNSRSSPPRDHHCCPRCGRDGAAYDNRSGRRSVRRILQRCTPDLLSRLADLIGNRFRSHQAPATPGGASERWQSRAVAAIRSSRRARRTHFQRASTAMGQSRRSSLSGSLTPATNRRDSSTRFFRIPGPLAQLAELRTFNP